MSTRGPSQVSSNGLALYYDTFNEKSYLGEPTANYSYDHNPRIDPSYSLWSPGYGGTFATKHPDAIRVYNDAGTEITSYVNTGVTDWTNTYHAIWTYDSVLQRPVVTMRDIDGQWKAKYIYTGINFNSLGMTVGSKYTISWLQWTDNLTKRANVGLYTRNNSVVYNFWDGLSEGSSTSTNTLTNTWQRVYHTFTVTSNWNLSDSWNQIYMYGHYYTTATVKIADVQFELKDHPTQFSKAQTRSVTTGLRDLVGSNTINLTNAGFDSSANLTFDGSTKYIDCSGLTKAATCTFEAWAKTTTLANSPMLFNAGNNGAGPDLFFYSNQIHWNTWDGGSNPFGSTPSSVTNGKYHHYVVVNDAGSNAKLYYDGSLLGTATYRTAAATTRLIVGGEPAGYLWTGDIPLFSVYSRALTASEVLQNFNKTKSRYGY